MIPRRLRIALAIAAVGHALLIIAGRYRLSYDAYTHMFFADHYLHNWGSLWDERWYGGFTMVSYPPLIHQVIALLASVTGVDAAFAIVLFIVVALLPAAVYSFARIFLEPESAGNAAIGAALLPAFYLSAHVFGQLPTLAALLLALFALASLARFLRSGNRVVAALTVALLASVVAAHHATLLFLPFGIGAVVGHLLMTRQLRPRKITLRLIAIGLPSVLACFAVIWPFWIWGMNQVMQTPIDHLSRHNYLADPAAISFFFLPIYGLMILVIPFVFWCFTRRAFIAPAFMFIALFVLGLGGTTLIPRLLFGAGWEWLTYDRFALWASTLLLIFFGRLVTRVQHRFSTWFDSHPILNKGLYANRVKRFTGIAGVGITMLLMVTVALSAALYPIWSPTQPPQIDLGPIVSFLGSRNNAQWRYLTFGFGDQYAVLSLETTATTIDGSYHTARQLPVLRTSGIGQIDSIFWSARGLSALDPILDDAALYGVRWGFVDRAEYIPVLQRHGWAYNRLLPNGVAVWENPNPGPAVVQTPPPLDDPLTLFAWQVFPLTALALAGVLAATTLRPDKVRRALLHLHSVTVGLLPVGLCFWYYRTLVPIPQARIYFTYTDVLLYTSDALIIISVIAWGLSKWISPASPNTTALEHRGRFNPVTWLTRLLLCLCILATLSALWSVDPRLSLATSAHLWLLFAFYLSLKDNPVPLSILCAGASVALLLEAGIGYIEVAQQSTAFLTPLNMKWPGVIDPNMRGASVVQLSNGSRWLRAYGTLPHPNILGGIASIALMVPSAWLLLRNRLRWPAIMLIVAGISLIFLAFSRSAWLGCVAAGAVLVWHHRHFMRRRLVALGLVILVGVLAIAIPLNRMVFTRVAGFDVPTEQQSIEVREWMTEHSLMMIRDHPLLGVGIGSFVVELVNRNPGNFVLEPAHNVLLLVVSELGVSGLVLLIGIIVTLCIGMFKASHPLAVISAAMVICLASAAAFDHYLWTIGPGRDLLWLVLGVWAGWQGCASSQDSSKSQAEISGINQPSESNTHT